MRLVMSRLYVILDAGLLREPATETARKLIDAGVHVLQYRSENDSAKEMLVSGGEVAGIARETRVQFLVNDRADVAYLAGAHGVHVGQDDLGVEEARAVVGPHAWVGFSTHNVEQFEKAARTSADYIAVGPIFATTSKANPHPVVGLELIRRARRMTEKPIVAIGGITLESAVEAIEAGGACVAVIRDVVCAAKPGEQARRFLET